MSGYVAIAYGIVFLVIGIGILIVKISEWCKECHEERQAEQQQGQQSTQSATRDGMAPSPFSDQVPMTSPPHQQQPINRTTIPITTTNTNTFSTNTTSTTTRTNTSNILFTNIVDLHSKPTGTGPIIMSRSDLMSLDTIDLIQILKDRDVMHNDIYLKADYVHRILTMCSSSSAAVAAGAAGAGASSSSGQQQQQQCSSSVVVVHQLNDETDDDLPSSPYYYDVEAPYSSQQQQQQGFIHVGIAGSTSAHHPPPPPLISKNNNASRTYQRQDSLNSYSRQTPSGVSQLVCGICNELMGGNTDRPPAAPGCGHTFCHECLHRWISEKRLCPQCRSPSTVSDIRKLYNI